MNDRSILQHLSSSVCICKTKIKNLASIILYKNNITIVQKNNFIFLHLNKFWCLYVIV